MDRLFKALADGKRRKIIKLLRKKAMYPKDLAKNLGIANSTLSEHLKVLHYAGLVEKERQGNSILYFLNASVLEEVLLYISEIMYREDKDAKGL